MTHLECMIFEWFPGSADDISGLVWENIHAVAPLTTSGHPLTTPLTTSANDGRPPLGPADSERPPSPHHQSSQGRSCALGGIGTGGLGGAVRVIAAGPRSADEFGPSDAVTGEARPS